MPRNLYVVLGIPSDASADMIRSAYRALAKAYHPDSVGPSGTSRFREISEAYRALCDPALREAHNAALAEERAPAEPLRRWGPDVVEPMVAEPIVLRRNFHTAHPSIEDEFVDWTMRHFTERRIPKSGSQRVVNVEVILSPEEALVGETVPIEVPAFAVCPACGGTGHDWYSFCDACGGLGVREGRRTARISIPPLVRDGTMWEVPLPDGGIYLRVCIRVDPYSR